MLFRIHILDKDSGNRFHTVSHLIFAHSAHQAVDSLKKSYGPFEGWRLKAVPHHGKETLDAGGGKALT